MKRYFTIPRPAKADAISDGDGWVSSTATVVLEPHQEPRHTGLYDAHGAPLYSVEEREPVGFALVRR